MENIDSLKGVRKSSPAYQLSNANVFVSSSGYHYIDYLDPVEDVSLEMDESSLTLEEGRYIESLLQSNLERFNNQVSIIKKYVPSIQNRRVLDIGCGGGLFLSLLRDEGAETIGIELNKSRASYARKKHNLQIVRHPIEDTSWMPQAVTFDVITLWDVIEHVNYPLSTLRSAARMLKAGGLLFIDTPCRDSFYHRCGEITYKLSNGRFPTFLNSIYSAQKFGHKQIFSTSEMNALFNDVGLEVVELRTFHELSFPYSVYLRKMFKSNVLVNLALPIVHGLLVLFPIKNKMLVVGRKKHA